MREDSFSVKVSLKYLTEMLYTILLITALIPESIQQQPVSGFVVKGVGTSHAEFVWDKYDGAITYTIHYFRHPQIRPAIRVENIPNTLTSYRLDGLSPETSYGARITAVIRDKVETRESATVIFITINAATCAINNGGCEDICTTVRSLAVCSCNEFGSLRPDGKTCYVEPMIFVVHGGIIEFIRSNLSVITLTNVTNSNVLVVAGDHSKKRFFYGTLASGKSEIGEFSINGKRRRILSRVNGSVEGMVYNNATRKLYLAINGSPGSVSVIEDVDAAKITINTLTTASSPRGLAIDPTSRYLFISDWGSNLQIVRYDLVSRTQLVIANSSLGFPNAVAVVNQTIIWGDARTDKIEMANFDGSNRTLVALIPNTHLFAMIELNGSLYWTDWNSNSIQQTNLANGTTTTYKSVQFRPDGIDYFGAGNIGSVTPCSINNGGCEDICETVGSSARCSFNEFGSLRPDGKTCYVEPMVMVANGGNIDFIRSNSSRITLTNFKYSRMNVVAGDYAKKRFFFGSIGSGKTAIGEYSINGKKRKNLIEVDGTADGMIYSNTTRKLYLATLFPGRVAVIEDVDAPNITVNTLINLPRPRGLVIDPTHRYLFVTDWGRFAQIRRYDFLTRTDTAVINSGLVWPNAIAIQNQKIIWGDGNTQKIEMANFDGSNRQLVAAIPSSLMFAMILLKGSLYWTDTNSDAIKITHLSNGNTTVYKRLNFDPYGIDYFGYENIDRNITCSVNNGGCEDICITVGSSSRCSCNEFGSLRPDGKTCYVEPMIFVANGGNIDFFRSNSSRITLTNFKYGQVNVVAADYKNKRFFYGTVGSGKAAIGRFSINGKTRKILIEVNGTLDGMIYHNITRKLYLALVNPGRVAVIEDVDALSVTINTLITVPNPRGLVIDSTNRYLFVSDWSSNPKVLRYDLLTRTQIAIVNTGLRWPNALVIHNQKVIWGDASTDKIEMANFDGSNRQLVSSIPSTHIFAMIILNGSLYWTDWNSDVIQVTQLFDGSTSVYKRLPNNPYGIDYFGNDDSGFLNATVPPTITTTATPSPQTLLYPYGVSAGDTRIPAGDDTTTFFRLRSPMLLFSTKRDTLHISINGVISFDGSRSRAIRIPNSGVFISIFDRDLDTRRNGGDIYFRETTDPAILSKANSDVNRLKHSNFRATRALVATYIEVHAYRSPNFNRHTFQLVLVTDDKLTFAILNYKKLDTTSNTVGFTETFCNYKLFARTSSLLTVTSNIGIQGRHVHQLTDDNCFKPLSGLILSKHSLVVQPSVSQFTLINNLRSSEVVPSIEGVFVEGITNNIPVSTYFQSWRLQPRSISMVFSSFFPSDRPRSLTVQSLVIFPGYSRNSSFHFGKLRLSAFSEGVTCSHEEFPLVMTSKPSIKLSVNISTNSPSLFFHTNTWLRNVTRYGFDICYREAYTFSGTRNITIDYLAISNSSDTINEQGHHLLPADRKNLCTRIPLKKSYYTAPYVFITPEDTSYKHSSNVFIAWVKNIGKNFVDVCAQTTEDDFSDSTSSINIHYVVHGNVSACTYVECPSHLECRLDVLNRPYCGCISSCSNDTNVERLCGNDFKTYNSQCELDKQYCEKFGNESRSNVTMAHLGKCERFAYQNGRTQLDAVPGIPVAFCKFITLNPVNFHPTKQMHVQLSVLWSDALSNTSHDATAVWSEDVTTNGFKACLLVAGRHFFGLSGMKPSVNWFAYQDSAIEEVGNERIEGGVINMKTWYTGGRCQRIPLKGFISNRSLVLVSVEHSASRTFSNAMTAWVEKSTGSVCVREFQNFDGEHSGIKVHWLVLRGPPYIDNANELLFPRQHYRPGDHIPPLCQGLPHNVSNSNVTVLLTGTMPEATRLSNRFSNHGVTTWIEKGNKTGLNACYKSILTSYTTEVIGISYVTIPIRCEEGWDLVSGNCHKKFDGCYSYNAATALCASHNAFIPTVESGSEGYYMRQMSEGVITWIGLTDVLNEGSWVWRSGSTSSYREWLNGKPNGGRNANCAVVDGTSNLKGWADIACTSCAQIVCQKRSQDFP